MPVAASPFVWLDPGPTSAQRAIALIAATFARVDINHLQLYHRNAEAYNGKLENLDTWIRRQVRDWPRIAAGKEEVVAMQSVDNIWDRFADRYDIELRLATKLAAYSPPLPASTPLFRDRLSAPPAASSSATRPPDGVLHALGDSDYERMMPGTRTRRSAPSLVRGNHQGDICGQHAHSDYLFWTEIMGFQQVGETPPSPRSSQSPQNALLQR